MKRLIVGSIILISMLIGVNRVMAETYNFSQYGAPYTLSLNCDDKFVNGKLKCNLSTTAIAAISGAKLKLSGDGVTLSGGKTISDYFDSAEITTGKNGTIKFNKNSQPSSNVEGVIGSIEITQTRLGAKQVVLALEVNDGEFGEPFSKYYDLPKLISLKINDVAQDITKNKIALSTRSDSVKIEAIASEGATATGHIGTFKLNNGLNKYTIKAIDNVLTQFSETYEIEINKEKTESGNTENPSTPNESEDDKEKPETKDENTKNENAKNENAKNENIKNPETSDKGLIYIGGLVLTLIVIIMVRKKMILIK